MTMTKADYMKAAASSVAAGPINTSIGDIYIKEVTCDDNYYIQGGETVNEHKLRERAIVACLCDADGERVFSKNDLDSVCAGWSDTKVDEVFTHVKKHCGAWVKQEDDAEGNS